MYPGLYFADKVTVSRPGLKQRLWSKLIKWWRKYSVYYDLYNEHGEKAFSNVESQQEGLEGRVFEVLNILKVVCPKPGHKIFVIGSRETGERYFVRTSNY